MNRSDRPDTTAAAASTVVTLELDETLRGIRESDSDAARILIEGVRGVADLYRLCVLITPWTAAEMRGMLRELEDVTWARLAVGGQLCAELKRSGTAAPEKTVPEFFDPARIQAVEDFVNAKWRATSRRRSAGLDHVQRGAIHSFTWSTRGTSNGRRLEQEAREAGLATVFWAARELHLLPSPVGTADMALELVRETGVQTVLAITDAEPGTRLQQRLREEPGVRSVISVAVEPLSAETGSFDATVDGARKLGELLWTFTHYGRIEERGSTA